MSTIAANTLDLGSFDLEASNIDDFADLQVISLADAIAMPETGASSLISSCCGACSCCGSTSCCGVPTLPPPDTTAA